MMRKAETTTRKTIRCSPISSKSDRDDKRNGVTDRLSDYYRKFSSLTAQSSKAPPDPGGARNAHAKAPGQRVPFSLSAPFSE